MTLVNRSLLALTYCAAFLTTACGAADESGGQPSNAGGLRTEDGYPVVVADPAAWERANRREKATEPPETPPAPVADQQGLVREPTTPDPEAGNYTLEEAVLGLGTDGELVAEIVTDLGAIFCELHSEKSPIAVANFVGLARGKRPWWDARAGAWRSDAPYYNGTSFHRVIPGFMIQGGDYLGDGSGTVGYVFPDERHGTLLHDRAGQLCMANRGPNTNSAQFFITDAAAPHLDSSYTIFGQCEPTAVVSRVARVPQGAGNRPLTDVAISRVYIRRVVGGLSNARRTAPQLPEGQTEVPTQRGASAPPGHLGHGH